MRLHYCANRIQTKVGLLRVHDIHEKASCLIPDLQGGAK